MKLPVFIAHVANPRVDHLTERVSDLNTFRRRRNTQASVDVRFTGSQEDIGEFVGLLFQLMNSGAPITLDTWDVLRKAAAAPSEPKIKALPVGIIDGILEDE